MLKYEIITRKTEPLPSHFRDISGYLEELFREVNRDYACKFYDLALIPHSLSKPIEENPSLVDRVAQWHWAREIPIKEIHYVEGLLSREDAVNLIEDAKEVGALHFDVTTPYKPLQIGNKEYSGVALLEMDLFPSFDVVLHLNRRKEKELIQKLRKKYHLFSQYPSKAFYLR